MPSKKSHQRVNDILLGPLERPALAWFAAHMPRWMTPDKLTLIGIGGALMIAVGYAFSGQERNFLWVASLGLFVNWFGDSLDGTLARFRRIERPKYGYFIDHTVDCLNALIVMLGLGLSPFVRFDIALLALIGYLLMSVMVYIRTYVEDIFQISYGRLGPTEVRAVFILLNTYMFFAGPQRLAAPFDAFTPYDAVVAAIALLLFVLYVNSMVRQGSALRALESGAAQRAPER